MSFRVGLKFVMISHRRSSLSFFSDIQGCDACKFSKAIRTLFGSKIIQMLIIWDFRKQLKHCHCESYLIPGTIFRKIFDVLDDMLITQRGFSTGNRRRYFTNTNGNGRRAQSQRELHHKQEKLAFNHFFQLLECQKFLGVADMNTFEEEECGAVWRMKGDRWCDSKREVTSGVAWRKLIESEQYQEICEVQKDKAESEQHQKLCKWRKSHHEFDLGINVLMGREFCFTCDNYTNDGVASALKDETRLVDLLPIATEPRDQGDADSFFFSVFRFNAVYFLAVF